VRRFLPELIDLIWNRQIDPGKVFDLELPLDDAAAGYAANGRTARDQSAPAPVIAAASSGRAVEMARLLITGSTAGLGWAAARHLLDGGHEVVLHARNSERAGSVGNLAGRAAGVVVGDLGSADETRGVADQVNTIGGIDAVINNAAIYVDRWRVAAPEGHARTLAMNALAPYMLTAWIDGPSRLVYITSSMHKQGIPSLRDVDWTARSWSGVQAYSDSKLFITALAFAVARRWADVHANVVDPGWVATKMGGAGAPDDLGQGHRTQTWLAVSNDPDATRSGGYWYHEQPQPPAPGRPRREPPGRVGRRADPADRRPLAMNQADPTNGFAGQFTVVAGANPAPPTRLHRGRLRLPPSTSRLASNSAPRAAPAGFQPGQRRIPRSSRRRPSAGRIGRRSSLDNLSKGPFAGVLSYQETIPASVPPRSRARLPTSEHHGGDRCSHAREHGHELSSTPAIEMLEPLRA
jgi:NAD(P)-dependent dehydrogenase (short-subunit alcohol dehydrogenase family)